MWRYSGNPASSLKDQVRYLVGDTSQHDGLITDEEIEFCLLQSGNAPGSAAVRACEAIIARLSLTAVDQTVGSVSASLSQRLTNYRDLLTQLRDQQSRASGAMAYAGGIHRVDRHRQEHDHRFVRATFGDNANSGNPRRDKRITNPPWRDRDDSFDWEKVGGF